MLISKLGVNEEEPESFILDVYNRSIGLGLSSENIAFHLKDLLEFSKPNSNNTNNILVPLSQISEYIQQKADEKKKLEGEIQTLKAQLKTLSEEKSNSEQRRNSALNQEHTSDAELKSFSDLKQELGHYGLPIYDIPKFAKAVKGLSHKHYDVGKIIIEYSDYEDLKHDYFYYKAQILDLDIKCSQLQGRENYYTQRLSLIDNLQGMGFGFKELKSLWHTIVEISDANNISREDAVKRFFKEVDNHYDDILGFKSRKHELEAEVNDLGQQKLKLVVYLNAFRKFGSPFEKFLGIMNSTSPDDVNLLFDKLDSVGGVRTAIKKLSNKLTLSSLLVHHETNALSNTNTNANKNNDGDGNSSNTEKSITSESAHLSITYRENSTTGKPAGDKIAG
jgi:predicted  nucleic acid-binding Zn-ribbon protein